MATNAAKPPAEPVPAIANNATLMQIGHMIRFF